MKIKILYQLIIISICAVMLNACAVSSKLDSAANKRVNEYQRIINIKAYKDSDRTLYLCADLIVKGKDKPQTVSTKITWDEFYRKSFTNIEYVGGGQYLLDARIYKPGCDVEPGFTPIEIERVTVPWEGNRYAKLRTVIKYLPENEIGYTLYFLNYANYPTSESKCRGIFGIKDCYYHLTKHWPRLKIFVKSNRKHQRPPVTIRAGHTGEKVGHNPVKTTGAALVDIVTFPLQALILTFWSLFGSK